MTDANNYTCNSMCVFRFDDVLAFRFGDVLLPITERSPSYQPTAETLHAD